MMTCVVGIVHEGTVWLGGDSIAIDDLRARTIVDPKVFVNGPLAIGYCDSFRAGQLMKYALVPPPHRAGCSDMEYMVVDFVDALRELWSSKGILKNENDVNEVTLNALVGYRGNLYYVESDLQVGQVSKPCYAIGCGADIALGALHVAIDLDLAPEEKLRRALEAAAEWSAGVRLPFSFVSVGSSLQRSKKSRR